MATLCVVRDIPEPGRPQVVYGTGGWQSYEPEGGTPTTDEKVALKGVRLSHQEENRLVSTLRDTGHGQGSRRLSRAASTIGRTFPGNVSTGSDTHLGLPGRRPGRQLGQKWVLEHSLR